MSSFTAHFMPLNRAARCGKLAVLALWSCAEPKPLGVVSVGGGTPEQRTAVVDALAQFDLEAAPGRVWLRRVSFDADRVEGWLGRYIVETQEIFLAPSLAPQHLPWLVRHELCHALDFQQGVVNGAGTPFDPLVPALVGDDFSEYPSPWAQRHEAFARLCERGPEVAALLEEGCAAPEELTVAFHVVHAEVWRGGTWFPRAGPPSQAVGWTAPLEVEQFTLTAGSISGRPAFKIIALGDGPVSNAFATVDAETGAPLSRPFEAAVGDFDGFSEPIEGGEVVWLEGEKEGATVGLVVVDVDPFDVSPRLVVRSGQEPWAKVPGVCPEPGSPVALAAVGGRLWFASSTGQDIHWVEVFPIVADIAP